MPEAVNTPRNQLIGASAFQHLLSGGLNVNALRTNDVLQTREWLQYDAAVVEASEMSLNGVADLMALGLTYNLPNALGTTVVQWDDVSHMNEAEQSMDGISRQSNDRVEFGMNSVPVFITNKDFRINLRTLEASRRLGNPLDVTQASDAARRVAEKLEKGLFQGPGITVSGSTAYGYTNFPQRHTVAKIGDWSAAATITGVQIVDDVIKMIGAAQTDFYFGPYILYVSQDWWNRLQDDYKATSDVTILERIAKLTAIKEVKSSGQIPAQTALLVQITRDVVDLVVGQEPAPVTWESEGGFIIQMKVFSIIVPRLKFHQDGKSGIVHLS